ncbi:phosphate transport system regulatory protein PhoU, partial [Streptococcus danieliae]|nr:phosphate transport system regulatory protein PhoU [Streptococcus danieliae]
ELARAVIEEDADVNKYEVKLEEKSLEIIALQQPVSHDLRTVITILKASSDIERMGDHAVSIAQATIRMKGEVRIESVEQEINKMGKKVKEFVEATLDLYLKGDVDSAYQ